MKYSDKKVHYVRLSAFGKSSPCKCFKISPENFHLIANPSQDLQSLAIDEVTQISALESVARYDRSHPYKR